MTQHLAERIETLYNCRVYAITAGRKQVFKLKTSRGDWLMKRYREPYTARWVTRLCRQLPPRGFDVTIPYVRTREGKTYFICDGRAYTVMKKLPGRHASFRRQDDLHRTISCLASFHRAAQNIEGGPIPDSGEPPLLRKWRRRTTRFEKVVAHITRKKRKSDIEKRILEMAPHLIEDARDVMDILARSPIQEDVKKSVLHKKVAHRDLASHNFLVSGHGCYLIDYDTAMYDSQLVDLIQILGRILPLQSWDFDLYAELIDTYQHRIPLTDRERSLIYTLLRYPDDFMREVNGCYREDEGFHPKNLGFIVRTAQKTWENRRIFFEGAHYFLTV
ncbi:MAG: phosphotransferase [Bacillaceae bacterium]|nr:phosphotransferase [Bacillaceae bacterium]